MEADVASDVFGGGWSSSATPPTLWSNDSSDPLGDIETGMNTIVAAVGQEATVGVIGRGLWRYLMPVLFVMSHSIIYEMTEWVAAELFGGDLGMAYLGTQGDVWDAQKDMALATAGALTALLLGGVSGRIRRIQPVAAI